MPATRRDSGLDLAASACLVVDLSAAFAGTGPAHQNGLITSLSALRAVG